MKVLVILLLLFSFNFCFSQTKNVVPLNFSQSFDSLYDLKDVSLFVVGEIHHMSGNYRNKLDMFKRLHERGFNYMLYESSYSKGFIMNEYVKGEDIAIPNSGFFEREIQFIDSLKTYYKELSEVNKFEVKGIDLEWNNDLNIYALNYIITKVRKSNYFDQYLVKFNAFKNDSASYSMSDYVDVFEELLEGLNSDVGKSREFFGLYYKDVRIIVENSIKHADYTSRKFVLSKDPKDKNIRDGFMFENMQAVYRQDTSAKCFLQIGAFHLSLVKDSAWMHCKGYQSVISRYVESVPNKQVIANLMIYKERSVFNYLQLQRQKISKGLYKSIHRSGQGNNFTLYKVDHKHPLFSKQMVNYQYLIFNCCSTDVF